MQYLPPQFFTATILNWKHLLKPDKYKQIILNSLSFLVKDQRILLYGFVIMPNHIHVLWRISPSRQLKEVQRDFLKFTAQQIKFDLAKHHPEVLAHFEVNLKDRQHQFWQRNPLSIDLYSPAIFEQKLAYIHANPLQARWNLVEMPQEYWYSSYRFYEFNRDDFGILTHYQEG